MILVTGATGNVGRELVELLRAEGEPVRAVTRDAAKAGPLAGAEVVQADPSQPESLRGALAGVHGIFLNLAALGGAGAELLALAGECGVRRVVLLSSGSVEISAPEEGNLIAEMHRTAEQQIEASGLAWTFLRPNEFAANSLFQWAPQVRASDVVRSAYGQSQMAPIHERDIAAVAALALRTGEHDGQSYLMTGPESLTVVDKVRIIGEVIGRDLRFEELSREEGEQVMVQSGLPAPLVATLLDYQAATVGTPAQVSTVVPELTGRPGLSYATWVAEHAAAFRAA
ncbi:NAD(P)H-binding protein [Kitasatospora sp. NPDC006697]|uniref:NAD(P)H-binding protein n=1 Tax=Kitasatospora sp. NPDC006697 TaxID=3364020 RepID=UPI0036B7B62D